MIEMLKKINLSRALRTMHELFPEEYNFYPRSWILPDEYQQFSAQVSKRSQPNPDPTRTRKGLYRQTPPPCHFMLLGFKLCCTSGAA